MSRFRPSAAESSFRLGLRHAEAGAERLTAWVCVQPWRFVIAMTLIYGYGYTDFGAFERLTQNPFTTLPDKSDQFLHSSPFGFFIGWPLTDIFGARFSYLAVIALGFATLYAAIVVYSKKFLVEQRFIILMVMFSSPVIIVLLRWMGKDDCFVLAFLLLFVALRDNSLARAILALFLVLSHKEIGTIVIIADGLIRKNLRWPALLGLLAGQAIVSFYIAGLSVPPFSRVDLNIALLRINAAGWITNPLTHLCLSFGWFWIFLLRLRHEADAWRIFAVAGCTFAVAAGGADFTRDVVMSTSPVLIYVAERIAASPPHAGRVLQRPFPLLFLIQFQMEAGNQVRDLMWPTRILEWSKVVWAMIVP